jgi:hypothetical protein
VQTPVEEPQSISASQPHQRMAEVDDRLQHRPQQILLTIVSWHRHRIPHADPIAQIKHFRRLATRYEKHTADFLAFAQAECRSPLSAP